MKRAVIFYTVFAIAFWGLNLRVAYIIKSDSVNASVGNSDRIITAADSRGYIYDRNFYPLVNAVTIHKAAVIPYDGIETELAGNTSKEDIELVKKGKPCIITVDYKRKNSAYVKYFDVVDRYGQSKNFSHIVGYTDSQNGSGLAGMEKSFDELLSECSGSVKVKYSVDARGFALPDCEPEIVNESYNLKGGVRLTIDSNLQNICCKAAELYSLDRGAVVVLDSKTCEILACTSVPEYDPDNIADCLNDEKAPFLNRYLTSYTVGSVFKPITAAAALENGIGKDYSYECTGSINVGGITFHCHKKDGHGKLDMSSAMAVSCNTYFISLALQVGGEKIRSMASALGFGEKYYLTDTISSDAGSLPSDEELSNIGGTANLSFGQGSLTATPLHLAAVYSCIASGGIYTKPYILMQQLNRDGDSFAEFVPDAGVRVMSENTASVLKDFLNNTVKNGSGKNAEPNKKTAAGKTATAQTGIFENGEEIHRTWFCGYFPAEKPKYTVVVLKEDGTSPTVDCAPIFKYIADNTD